MLMMLQQGVNHEYRVSYAAGISRDVNGSGILTISVGPLTKWNLNL